jgi:hypothetical protein
MYTERMRGREPQAAIDDPEYIREMLRENVDAQRRIQAEIKTIDAAEASGAWADRMPAVLTGVRIDIFHPTTALASWSAEGIAKALSGAGFQAVLVAEPEGLALEQPRIESGVGASASALFLQGAFRIAEIPVKVTIDHRLTNTLRLHVGRDGLVPDRPKA